ncbi:plasminogen [Elysia marginata]|uniref:Plasminogen n=1 Tax=Elysia marginata TaxID=1093978 RepID=A0AAV4JD61_9GAST|nr:plasminogen [Elysia marginata]
MIAAAVVVAAATAVIVVVTVFVVVVVVLVAVIVVFVVVVEWQCRPKNENLDITDLVPRDSGVYACVVSWGADDTVKQNLTLGVFSLEVETEGPTRYVFEQQLTKMDCHSVTLGELFPDAVRYWLFNGTHTPTLPVTKASNRTCDVIRAVNKSMSGVWECQVLQQRTARVWATAWYNISVQDPPTGADRAFRNLQENWYTVVVAISVFFALLLIIFCFSAFKLKKIQDDVDEQFRDEREGWEDTLIKYGENGKINMNKRTPPSSRSGSKDEDDIDSKIKQKMENLFSVDGPQGDSGKKSMSNRKSETRPKSRSSKGDGGDGGHSEEKMGDSETEGSETTDTSDNLTGNNAYAQLGRNRTFNKTKKNTRKGREGQTRLLSFDGDSNENNRMCKRYETSKRALKFGKSLLAKHKDKDLPTVTTEDALSWLKLHSKSAKGKGRAPKLQTHQLSQPNPEAKIFNLNKKSNLVLEKQFDKPNTDASFDVTAGLEFGNTRAHSKKKVRSNEGSSIASCSKLQTNLISDSRGWPSPMQAETNRWFGSKTATHPRHPCAEYSLMNCSEYDENNTPKSLAENIVYSSSRPIVSLKPTRGNPATDFDRQVSIPSQWRSWLSASLSASKTAPWTNNQIVYTALPQNDDGHP